MSRVLRIVPAVVVLAALPLVAAGEPSVPSFAEPLAVDLPVLPPLLECTALAGVDVSAAVGAGTGITAAALTTASSPTSTAAPRAATRV